MIIPFVFICVNLRPSAVSFGFPRSNFWRRLARLSSQPTRNVRVIRAAIRRAPDWARQRKRPAMALARSSLAGGSGGHGAFGFHRLSGLNGIGDEF